MAELLKKREVAIFAHNVRALRKVKDYTLTELAIRVGVDRATVCRWEKGVNGPYPDHEARLAEVLSIETEKLWERPLELKAI